MLRIELRPDVRATSAPKLLSHLASLRQLFKKPTQSGFFLSPVGFVCTVFFILMAFCLFTMVSDLCFYEFCFCLYVCLRVCVSGLFCFFVVVVAF